LFALATDIIASGPRDEPLVPAVISDLLISISIFLFMGTIEVAKFSMNQRAPKIIIESNFRVFFESSRA
jgi:hypothetical protein